MTGRLWSNPGEALPSAEHRTQSPEAGTERLQAAVASSGTGTVCAPGVRFLSFNKVASDSLGLSVMTVTQPRPPRAGFSAAVGTGEGTALPPVSLLDLTKDGSDPQTDSPGSVPSA